MKQIRIGKDISLRWEITTDGVAMPLEGRDLTVELKSPIGKVSNMPFRVDGNVLIMTYYGYEQTSYGEYSLTLWENRGKLGQNVVDAISAFKLVRTSQEEDDFIGGDLQVECVDLGTANLDILFGSATPGDSPELSALKSRISAVEDKNTEQDARINAQLQDTPWEGQHINAFTDTGEYHIHGERTDANDGLPILNSGTIDARLTVLDSSLTNGTGAKTDIVVTQILRLSNRMGGDGHVYVRTAQAATKSQLATPSSTAWGTWEKLMGIFEKNNVLNIEDIDSYTTNGMYSGIYASESEEYGGVQFFHLDTFLIITINGYAVSKLATPQITQLLYKLPAKAKPLEGERYAEIYIRTGFLDANGWSWGPFLKTVTNMDLDSQVTTLNANINTISGRANAAETAATEAKKAANSAKVAAENEATARTEADNELQSQINGKQDNIDSLSKDEKAAFMVSLGLGKIGVVSQKQTWNKVGVEPAYVMSEKVEGFISKDNIDSLISYGFAFNEGTGYFELNGLTDISLQEALNIVAAGKPNYSFCDLHYANKKIRTNLPVLNKDVNYVKYFGNGLSQSIRMSCMALQSDIEVFVYMDKLDNINYTGFSYSTVSKASLTFTGCKNLEKIYVIPGTTSNYYLTFDGCLRLKELELVYLTCDVNLSKSSYLSAKSTHIMIANASSKNAKTITLHPDAKARWEASEYYEEDSQTIISKNITIA